MRYFFSLLFILSIPAGVRSQTRQLESFILNKDSVFAWFYDPLVSVIKATPDFMAQPDKERSALFDSYLHNNPLYLFKLISNSTNAITYYCIRGNPEKQKTKYFYRVEVIKDSSATNFDPLKNNYSEKIISITDQVNCGGTLFENMYLFDDEEKKKAVGNGILLFGSFRRVQPYAEIKESIIAIINKDQGH